MLLVKHYASYHHNAMFGTWYARVSTNIASLELYVMMRIMNVYGICDHVARNSFHPFLYRGHCQSRKMVCVLLEL